MMEFAEIAALPRGRRRHRGFSLLELLTTMAIVAMVLGFGVPNLTNFIRNNRMTAAANDLLSLATVARSEAIKRRVPVTVCASPNPAAANPSCGANNGWIAFVDDADTNGDGMPDGNIQVDAGEEVLRTLPALDDAITTFADGNYVSFAATGFSRSFAGAGAPTTEVLLCGPQGNQAAAGVSTARAIVFSPTGRGQILRNVDQVAIVEGVLGACP